MLMWMLGKKAVHAFIGGFGNGLPCSQYSLLREHYKCRIKSRLLVLSGILSSKFIGEGKKILHLTSCLKMVFPSTFDIYSPRFILSQISPGATSLHSPNYCDKEHSSDAASVNSSQMLSFGVKLYSEQRQLSNSP